MTLRADITSAYDEIIRAAPALRPQIRILVTAERNAGPSSRHLRGPWIRAVRGTVALVAALMVVLLVATLLIGGRVLQDWRAFTQPAPARDQPSELALLEARPIHLTLLQAGGSCPETPLNGPYGGLFPSGMYGSGPVYIAGGSSVSDPWGTYWYLAAVTDPRVTGLVLVRGQDLRTGQPMVFVGKWASGPVFGTDDLDGTVTPQHLDLVFDRRQPPLNTGHAGTFTWGFTAGLAAGASGCAGWQVDTTGYPTQIIVTRSTPGG
jgi:hypothetical protein